jgi:hypothetical protein
MKYNNLAKMTHIAFDKFFNDMVKYIDCEIARNRIDSEFLSIFIDHFVEASRSLDKQKIKKSLDGDLYKIIIINMVETIITMEPDSILTTDLRPEFVDVITKLHSTEIAGNITSIADSNDSDYVYIREIVDQYVTLIPHTIHEEILIQVTNQIYSEVKWKIDNRGLILKDPNTKISIIKLTERMLIYWIKLVQKG